jgi:hypothetical protein
MSSRNRMCVCAFIGDECIYAYVWASMIVPCFAKKCEYIELWIWSETKSGKLEGPCYTVPRHYLVLRGAPPKNGKETVNCHCSSQIRKSRSITFPLHTSSPHIPHHTSFLLPRPHFPRHLISPVRPHCYLVEEKQRILVRTKNYISIKWRCTKHSDRCKIYI